MALLLDWILQNRRKPGTDGNLEALVNEELGETDFPSAVGGSIRAAISKQVTKVRPLFFFAAIALFLLIIWSFISGDTSIDRFPFNMPHDIVNCWANASPASIKLAGFPSRGLNPEQWLLKSPEPPTKELWFSKLAELGLTVEPGSPGTHRNFCLTTSGGAKLRNAACIAQKYDYVVFFGDSLVREAAWSFARHVFEDNVDSECPIGKRWAQSQFQTTKMEPCLRCSHPLNSQNASGRSPRICGEDDPILTMWGNFSNIVLQNCCKHFVSAFFSASRSEQMAGVVAKITEFSHKCPCRGLFWLSNGIHEFLSDPKEKPAWTWPSRRAAGLTFIMQSLANLSNVTLYWSSVPAVSHALMIADPPKYDLHLFKQLLWVPQYAKIDRWALRNKPMTYIPYYEISRYYEGLQCDGMHFGESNKAGVGCRGYTSVTDVLIQLWLAKLCDGEEYVMSWYRDRDEVLADCSWAGKRTTNYAGDQIDVPRL